MKSLQYLSIPLLLVAAEARGQDGTVQVLGPHPTSEVIKSQGDAIPADSTAMFSHTIGLAEMWIYEFEWVVKDGGGTLYWYASDVPLPQGTPMPAHAVEVSYISPLAPKKVQVTLNNPAYRRKYLHFFIRAEEQVTDTAIRFDCCRRELWQTQGYRCP